MKIRRPWLLPLAPVYGAVLALKERMFRWGWLNQNRLQNTVISVGSVSAGGAGKTPVVLMLTEMLRHRGYAVRILTRGYGRRGAVTVERVEAFDDPRWLGDESVLLAQRSGAPVFVGAERYRAGLLAEQSEPTEKRVVHLLDDGFQHRQLARDVDIVLLTKEDVEDKLLPAGNLREQVATIEKADVVVLREEEVESLGRFVDALTREKSGPAIWVIRRTLSLGEGGEVALPTMPVAFCGIARPESFARMLKGNGYEPTDMVVFADHHSYGERDVVRLLERARLCGANGFVTTEKDAVKLTREMRERLETIGPIVVARLNVELVEEQEAMMQLVAMVGGLDRRRR